MEGFPDLAGGGGSSSSSASKASFLQLPLPAAASSSSPELAGEHQRSRLALQQLLATPPPSTTQDGHHSREISPADATTVKAKIMAHPLYPPLLASYLDCQKVTAQRIQSAK